MTKSDSKILARTNETTEGTKPDSEIYPIRMPKINIDTILKSLTHNTAVYVYSIAVTGKSIVNELQLCYRENNG